METQATSRRQPKPIFINISRTAISVFAGVSLFIAVLFIALIGFNLEYSGRIYPGIYLADVDLSGKTQEEAYALVQANFNYPQDGLIIFQEADKVWAAKPAELGLTIDARTSVLAAYSLGREVNLITRLFNHAKAYFNGFNLAPIYVYDQRESQVFLENIAAMIDRPTIEAELKIVGIEVVAVPGQVGRDVDIEKTLEPLEEHFRNQSNNILPLIVKETPPEILDASEQAEIAQKILSAPLTIRIPNPLEGDPEPWVFEPEAIASMLTIERRNGDNGYEYQVGLQAEGLRGFLESAAIDLEQIPANARFIFNDDTRQLEVIQAAKIGRSLNVDTTIQEINQKVGQAEHVVDMVLDYVNPTITDDMSGEQLGITELVSAETSYFYGSSAARIQNIQAAASNFHGLLIPPGETFSMAANMDDVSLDNGYAEALIIYGNRTIKGVGGGVCQVSTTLFRTAFFGGLPIVERHPHAYRVSYYELNAAGNVNSNLAGLDATVYVPVVDLKFINDTPYWLLMETYVNPAARSLTWKFYSTSDGRSVDWETTGLRNKQEPPEPLYQENPDLDKGEIKQVDWAAEGADVTVYRTVYRDDEVYFRDEFNTYYMPWRAVYEYGPGTKLPKD
jgi:vancomycin resistance protein YoaR